MDGGDVTVVHGRMARGGRPLVRTVSTSRSTLS